MNKRGIVIGSLTMIILILIIFGVIAFITVYIWKFADKQTDREICKFSLLAATKTKILGADNPVFRVDCKRHRVEINHKDVKGEGLVNEDKIYKIIQRELYECYNMIPESLFNRRFAFLSESQAVEDPWPEWSDEDNICLVCSIIEFEDKITDYTEHKTGKLSGFNQWLLENPVEGQEKNIYGVMFDTQPTEKNIELAKGMDKESPIDTTKTYAIVVRWKAKGFFSDLKTGFYSSFGILSIPQWVKNFNTLQCYLNPNENDPRCAGDFPIVAFMPIDNLGKTMTFEANGKTHTEKFCTVIWN